MPEIDVRSVTGEDHETLATFEHGYYSQYVWQLNLDSDPQSTHADFRRVRLPRQVMVAYPRSKEEIFSHVDEVEAFLVAELKGVSVGYIKVFSEVGSRTARVTDVVVSASMRRQGIASGLMVAVMNLVSKRELKNLIVELQAKNDPAIQMVTKMGFNFAGFRDRYFSNQELALFYSRYIR
jgi:ribosomal protein S18 acetylase RimI-like enzyme